MGKFYTITESVEITLDNFSCLGASVYADIRIRNAIFRRVRVYNGTCSGFDRERIPNKTAREALVGIILKGRFQKRMKSLSLLGISPGNDRSNRTVRKCPEFSAIVALTR